jgi:integrase
MSDRGDETPPLTGEILPPGAPPAGQANTAPPEAQALVHRLARGHPVGDELEALLAGPLRDAVTAAVEYAQDATSPATRATYHRYWTEFAAWCRKQAADPTQLPINPILVAAYLATLAPTHGKSALRARVAAIVDYQRRRGVPFAAAHPVIRETLSGIARHHGKPVRPAAALTSAEVRQLIATCRDDLAGVRDRALFLTGLAGGFRRSELVAMEVAHLRFDATGVVIHIPRSKGDQEGEGADVTLPRMRGQDTCPVQALETWLRRAGLTRGAVFRNISRHGTVEERLSGAGVRHILLRRAAMAKLTVHPSERLSPHGLRAGLITEAYLAGAPDEQVAAHSRHGDLKTMRGYRRRARITADNPARLLDL